MAQAAVTMGTQVPEATAPTSGSPRALIERLKGNGTGARLARGGLGTFGVAAVGTGLAMLLQVLVARLLGAREFGDYAYALSLVNLLSMIAVLGFEGASFRFVASYRGVGEWGLLRGYAARSLQLTLALATVIAIGMAAYVTWMGSFSPELRNVLRITAAMVPLLVIVKLSSAHVQGLQRIVLSQSMQQIVRPILFGAAMLVAAYFVRVRIGAAAAMTINVGVTAVTALVAWSAFRRVAPEGIRGATPAYDTPLWIRVAMPMFLISLSQTLLTSTDTLMLGTMLGTREAGLYSVASQLSTAVGFTITAVNGVVAPMIAELYARNDREALKRLIVLASRGTLLVATPVFVVLLVAGGPLLGLFGQEFRAAAVPMAILSFGQFMIVAFGSVGFLLTMTGREKEASGIIVLSAIVNVILNALLIPRFGMNGSASATMIATVLRSLLLAIVVRRALGFSAGAFGLRHGAP